MRIKEFFGNVGRQLGGGLKKIATVIASPFVFVGSKVSSFFGWCKSGLLSKKTTVEKSPPVSLVEEPVVEEKVPTSTDLVPRLSQRVTPCVVFVDGVIPISVIPNTMAVVIANNGGSVSFIIVNHLVLQQLERNLVSTLLQQRACGALGPLPRAQESVRLPLLLTAPPTVSAPLPLNPEEVIAPDSVVSREKSVSPEPRNLARLFFDLETRSKTPSKAM